jgi:hypothetical protein
MERLGHDGKIAHIGRLTFYLTPGGQMVVSLGNCKIEMSPEECRGALDYLLLQANYFATQSTNGHVPQLSSK